jgi:hypothetical protein
MTCQPYADAVVDPGAAAPPDLAQHLAGCADCRALASGHAVALKLEGLERADAPSVRARALWPRLGLAAAAVMLAAFAVRATWPSGSDAPPEVAVEVGLAADPRETTLLVAEPETDGWAELAALNDQVDGYARADASALALASLSTVPRWFALERLGAPVDALTFPLSRPLTQESP